MAQVGKGPRASKWLPGCCPRGRGTLDTLHGDPTVLRGKGLSSPLGAREQDSSRRLLCSLVGLRSAQPAGRYPTQPALQQGGGNPVLAAPPLTGKHSPAVLRGAAGSDSRPAPRASVTHSTEGNPSLLPPADKRQVVPSSLWDEMCLRAPRGLPRDRVCRIPG